MQDLNHFCPAAASNIAHAASSTSVHSHHSHHSHSHPHTPCPVSPHPYSHHPSLSGTVSGPLTGIPGQPPQPPHTPIPQSHAGSYHGAHAGHHPSISGPHHTSISGHHGASAVTHPQPSQPYPMLMRHADSTPCMTTSWSPQHTSVSMKVSKDCSEGVLQKNLVIC